MPPADFSGLEELDKRRPKPPAVLYKYLAPERVDVLEGAAIRFTPPLNTNDIFEVRQTFDLVMGPKMQSYFEKTAKTINFDEQFQAALTDSGLGFLSVEQAKTLISTFVGGDAEKVARAFLSRAVEELPAQLNTPENVERLLEKIASNQLLLSLSERADSSPMWAHYASNSSGFVIAFNTNSDFFRRGDNGESQGLHKVRYFDGRLKEIIEDPYVALISKQVDGAYEREWRLYVKPDQVSRVIEQGGDQI